ncbi:MAG: hypothetical protein ACYC6Q_08955, partial [Syntrophales bacterium]
WAGASVAIVAGYAKDLHKDFLACQSLTSLDDVHNVLSERFKAFIKDLETDAINYVNALAASSRERVAIYRTALWVWHRIDDNRWKMSCVPLKIGKRKPSLEVDHTVAYALWDLKLATTLPTGLTERAEALSLVNMLGNCSLLEKAFNISKSDKSLRSFMEQVHEFMQGIFTLPSWEQAIGLDASMADPVTATTDEILAAMRDRDNAIRVELIEFIKGVRIRKDV